MSGPLSAKISRRRTLAWLTGLGITSAAFARALAAEVEHAPIDKEAIARAEWVSGVVLGDDQRERLVRSVDRLHSQLREIRGVSLGPDVAPSLIFAPHADAYRRYPVDNQENVGQENGGQRQLANVVAVPKSVAPVDLPTSEIDIAFATIPVLGAMLRQGKITSIALTRLFLKRLEEHGPTLNCIVSLTSDLALRQAERADQELTAGKDRGPLHGIPWGAKDLISVPGYKTTWGAEPFREQSFDQLATVAQRLESAGAVLIAKLTLGAIAMGDEWFGGRTLNPWNLDQGSSGSSAGSAAATAAGLVPFALGTETLGSIVSPSRRCGTTGLRPTFGRVSRAGCMPLAWSFDKIGPICRSVEDCAIVFAAIQGPDGKDPSVNAYDFTWPKPLVYQDVKVGYTGKKEDRDELEILSKLGFELVPIELPNDLPVDALTMMLDVESASMFYDLWKDGGEEGLFRWARIWQTAAFVPAIDYVRAARVRTLVMQQMEQAISQVDVYVGGNDLIIANLTGHPTVVMPYKLEVPRSRDSENEVANIKQPSSLTFTGHLHQEGVLLAVAEAFQNAAGDHLHRPPMFSEVE